MRVLVALALLALPAQAETEECFTGSPRQIAYDTGRVETIIQRHGDDVTYTVPMDGFQDSVFKTHLMLFPKQSRQGARSSEVRWSSHLPDIEDMVPGYHFDLKGMMKSGEGKPLPYRVTGDVTGTGVVTLGKCPYEVRIVTLGTFLNDQPLVNAAYALSADMTVVLQSEVTPVATGKATLSTVVGLQ
jgi:hypothetical protein